MSTTYDTTVRLISATVNPDQTMEPPSVGD